MSVQLTTKRLRGEPLSRSHAGAMYPLLLEKSIYLYLTEEPPESLEAVQKRYEFLSSGMSPDGSEHWLNWILFLNDSLSPLGFFQASVRAQSASIAYVLHPDFQGKGYATEIVTAGIPYLFETFDIQSVVAEVHPENDASLRLLRRLGFSYSYYDSNENDVIYTLGRHCYLKSIDTATTVEDNASAGKF